MKMRSKFLVLSVLLMAGIFSLPRHAQAQNVYAAIHGSVKDSTGAVVPGATVTALNTSTGISTTATTDGSGYYIFPQLHIGGPYTVTVSKGGFQDFQSTGLMLNVNANRDVDAVMTVGATSQTIQVKSAAVQVETSDTQLKTIVGAKELEQLPLLGRDPVSLMKTSPGVVESSDRFGTFSANGGQTQMNSYLLEGTDINDGPLQSAGITPNPDALAEINIVTSTLNPEFSRNSGAIVNEVLKSGTNQFHGSGFEFYRDTFLNNGNYFSKTRPKYHQNLFGGTLGGPIFKNHTFFFLAYQGVRRGNGTTTNTRVPDAGEIASGNFSNDTNQQTGSANCSGPNPPADCATNGAAGLSTAPIPFNIQGPNGLCVADPTATTPETWADCFPAGSPVVIPTSSYNPIAASLASTYVPAPNTTLGGNAYYTFNSANTLKSDQGIIRIDEQLTHDDTLWGSVIFQSTPSFNSLPFIGATLPGFAQNNAQHFKVFNASYTHTFNPTTLNELRAGYYRFNYAAVEPAKVVNPASLGFSINPQDPSASGVPFMGLTGLFDLGFSRNGPQPRKDENLDFADNFTKIVGNHNMKFGAHVEKFVVSNPYYANNSGTYGFAGTGSYSSGDPLIDFLMGIPDSYAQGTGGFIDASSWELYFYAQDNWKVSDTLTVNYGIASDTETPFANTQYGGLGIICWAPTGQSKVYPTAPPGLLYPGDKGCNIEGGATTKYDHFAPRLGFAWSPESGPSMLLGAPGTHAFAVRGGFGVYFNRDAEEAQLQNLEDPPTGLNSQGATDVGGSPAFANPYQDVTGDTSVSEPNKFPFTPPAPGSPIDFGAFEPLDLNSVAPNYSVPYTYNFNLNAQRSLPSNMVLTVGYVGSMGRKLVRAYEADRMTVTGHAACLADPTCVAHRANFLSYYYPKYFTAQTNGSPVYFSVGRPYTDGASNYNALQVQLTKDTTHGLYFSVAYTYSHALDNASGLESSGFNGFPGTNGVGTNWVPGFQYLSYGNSDYDARHRLVILYNYQVPITAGMNSNRIVREFAGGWHITGITTLQTGFPVTIDETGTNNAMWCNGAAISYYACADVPETSTFDIPTMNPRKTGNYWFNPAPFSTEPIGTFGNTKRNFFHGPGFNYTNLEFYKDFPLGGLNSSRYIELRLEAYNAFNHPNFDQPDGNFSDGPTFGQISNVIQPANNNNANGDPQPGRAIQLAGKFYF